MKKLIFILLLLTTFLFSCQVAKPLKVKVEFIQPTENGYEVWVKYNNPHYRYRDFHLVKTFDTLPPDIKRDNILYLYPKKDTSGFREVK